MRILSRQSAIIFAICAGFILTASDVLAFRANAPISSAMTGPGTVQRIAVFGTDDRHPLPRNLETLSKSVGLISSPPEKTLCTGFCVGRRTVATAAHCLFRTNGERLPNLASFEFIVGRMGHRQSSRIEGTSTGNHRQHVVSGSTALRITPPIDATFDWALLRLARPVCQGQALFVERSTPAQIGQLATEKRLLNVAFHGDRRDWRLAVSKQCEITERLERDVLSQMKRDFTSTQDLVLHRCDTGLASSGSPLMALAGDNSLRVVAMNVGTYQQTRYLVTGRSVTRRFKPATVANTAIAGRAFADHVLSFARANIIGNREGVLELQRALNRIGLQAGPDDGIFGKRTRQALLAFERLTKQQPLGLATRQILEAAKRYR